MNCYLRGVRRHRTLMSECSWSEVLIPAVWKRSPVNFGNMPGIGMITRENANS